MAFSNLDGKTVVQVYEDGKSFYKENQRFLSSNVYLNVFFKDDAEMIDCCSKKEYAIRFSEGEKTLCLIKVRVWPTLFYGDVSLAGDAISFLLKEGYELNEIAAPVPLGNALIETLENHSIRYHLHVAMDFMECKEKSEFAGVAIDEAKENDAAEIFELITMFVKECDLNDPTTLESVKSGIGTYRLIRGNGKIIALARLIESTGEDLRISYVYTRKEERGKGLAKALVASMVNEALEKGYYASLTVDQKNPISNHVYESIGFKRLFAQGIYRPESK